MEIDVGRFHDLADVFASGADVTPAEACAAVLIGYLAAELDGSATREEREAFEQLSRDLCYVAGFTPKADAIIAHALSEDEQLAAIRVLARDLRSPNARELAYAMAYLAIAPGTGRDVGDSQVLEELRSVLDLDATRSSYVVSVAREVSA